MRKTKMSRKNYEIMLEQGFVDLSKYRYCCPNYNRSYIYAIPLLSVAMGSMDGAFECKLYLY